MSYLKEENGWKQRMITNLAMKRWEATEAPAILEVQMSQVLRVRKRREVRFLKALVKGIQVYSPGLFPARHLFPTDISSHRI
jgi:hypothetical protein